MVPQSSLHKSHESVGVPQRNTTPSKATTTSDHTTQQTPLQEMTSHAPENSSAGTRTCTVQAPAWHPPYEELIDLRYPLHFDHLVYRDTLFDHSLSANCDELEAELSDLFRERDCMVMINICTAITGVAAHMHDDNPPSTPIFFEVNMRSDLAPRISEFHKDIKQAIERHYPAEEFPEEKFPEVRRPIIRYFAGCDEEPLRSG